MNFGMTLAGIELRYLVNEIAKQTREYYLSNIYGVTRDSILFKLHHPQHPDVFLMFSNFGMWISSSKIDQIETNRLVKRLRSDLLRLKLIKIEQLEDERIAYLTFRGFEKEFLIIGEFFGEGNIILCNKDMKILALQHSINVRHRKLRVGLQYEPPPKTGKNIFEITEQDIKEIRSSSNPCAKWIGRTLGLPTKYAEAICKQAKINPKSSGNNLSEDEIKKIFACTLEIINQVLKGNHEAFVVSLNGNYDVYPIKLGNPSENWQKVSSFVDGLDLVFTKQIIEKGKSIQTNSVEKKILELETKLTEQEKAMSIVKEKSTEISKIAQCLFNLVSSGIQSIKDSKAVDLLSEQNTKLVSEKGITFLKIHDEKIKINSKASLPSIASTLFDEAKKQSNAIKSIKILKEKTEKNLIKLRNQAKEAQESVTFKEIKKKNWFERYRWFYTSDGLLAIGGRDASSNSSVIRKHLEKEDKVFHADIFGSPFFILKNSVNTPAKSLNEVAHATVCFSRAWREAMYGLSAYWVNPNQVKKAAPSGQFLPKGSFTIDGQRNFVKISSMKLSVGLIEKDDNLLISCGPPEPIKQNSLIYATIEPSGKEMTETAKKIKLEFTKLKGDLVNTINLDDFVRVLPAGKSHIVEIGIGEKSD